VLTPFQEELARLLASLPEADGFALAGGAALIARGVVDRRTADLDFFTREADAVGRLGPAFESAVSEAGMAVKRVQDAPGFLRLEVSRSGEHCEVDLGHDARLWPVQSTPLGPTVADNELAADKTLALFGRAAARDYVDVRALAGRFGEDRLIELAAAKDLGFSASRLADALAAFDRLDRDQFDLGDPVYRELRTWALSWADTLSRVQDRELQRHREPPDLGPDLGL
jgi:Nucleotidyl transferase AbiEii toxin, Type IV TA system